MQILTSTSHPEHLRRASKKGSNERDGAAQRSCPGIPADNMNKCSNMNVLMILYRSTIYYYYNDYNSYYYTIIIPMMFTTTTTTTTTNHTNMNN